MAAPVRRDTSRRLQSRLASMSLLASVAWGLGACGGGGGGAAEPVATTESTPLPGTTGGTPTPTPGTPGGTPTTPGGGSTPVTLTLAKLELAQTHVVPAQGRTWAQPNNGSLALHLAAQRAALALVDVSPADAAGLTLEGRVGATSLGSVPLAANTNLPPTEAGGDRYSATARVADVPASWVQPGLELRIAGSGAQPSAWQPVKVGAETSLTIPNMAFYLFGAGENLVPLSEATTLPPKATDEVRALWPITHFDARQHAIARIDWPTLVVGPREGGAAYVMSARDDRRDGFAPLSAVHSLTGALRRAQGDSDLNLQYYSAMVMANRDGTFGSSGGGLGGGHVGAGDHRYQGVFIHEQGHATGMPHAGESFAAGTGYPYAGGSLAGSAWAYDQVRREFRSTLVPRTASTFASCTASTTRQFDAQGRCIRQDPMQGGSGDQIAGDQFTVFSDYNAAKVQNYLEGVTTLAADGTRSTAGGRVVPSAVHATGYKRWDSLAANWVAFDPTVDAARSRNGVNNGFASAQGLPVYTVFFTHSRAGTAGATQIYPIVGPYTGNLLRTFDPTNSGDAASLAASSGIYSRYCHASGCDFTLRVSYADASVRHLVVQGAYRSWFTPTEEPAAGTADPLSSDSFKTYAINVPAHAAVTRVELLDTPQVAWNGIAANPAVIATQTATASPAP